ncbi:polysaccharide pyruvyl transferase family protein [Pedobacter sp. AW31-3R]|uniref:polysaccharide pyruvyl transferase family protein n=1 Tax=Pedobacter sp. AW31-3R TaxID=3445781 RepID=UPI003F9F0055
MQYLYFKSAQGNFGDDLNPWLWPQLLNTTSEQARNADYFIGIGSILHPVSKIIDLKDSISKKIVFGTGVRPCTDYRKLVLNDSWDIKFLRGPLSAHSLNNAHEYITDGAYAVRHLETFNDLLKTPKKYKISVMPYFHSVGSLDWRRICQDLGYHYISPFSENGVASTLQEIAASEYVITEAMHGAILADVLRVPWHRITVTTPYNEGPQVSEFKWMDWMYSIGLGHIHATKIKFYRGAVVNHWVQKLTNGMVKVELLRKQRLFKDVSHTLKNIKDYNLSADQVMDEIDNKIGNQIYTFNKP